MAKQLQLSKFFNVVEKRTGSRPSESRDRDEYYKEYEEKGSGSSKNLVFWRGLG